MRAQKSPNFFDGSRFPRVFSDPILSTKGGAQFVKSVMRPQTICLSVFRFECCSLFDCANREWTMGLVILRQLDKYGVELSFLLYLLRFGELGV